MCPHRLPNARFQPRRRIVARAAVGCKSLILIQPSVLGLARCERGDSYRVTDPGYDVRGAYGDGNRRGDPARVQRLEASTFETPIQIKIMTTAIPQAEALPALSHHSPPVARVASDNMMLTAEINTLRIREIGHAQNRFRFGSGTQPAALGLNNRRIMPAQAGTANTAAGP